MRARAFGGSGQVRYARPGGDTLVEVNCQGTRAADMRIRLTGSFVLDAADLIL